MLNLRLRLACAQITFGPGKADLLAHIHDSGSISAAGRAMGMSYKRAWVLVEEMNQAFAEPLVLSMRGGAGGGGAQLSPTGLRVLAAYRDILATLAREAAPALAEIQGLLAPLPSQPE